MTTYSAPNDNGFLTALPGEVLEAWLPQLESVDLVVGQVLYEGSSPQCYVYFPMTAIVSPVLVLHNGDTAAMAAIGCEGLVGISVFLGNWSMPSRAVVESAGRCFRLPAALAKQEFERSKELRGLVLRYAQALMTQISQNAACNRHHLVKAQLCRWILLCLDRLPGDNLAMTHELIAQLMGVRREGVTEAAYKLQAAGLIHYARGHIRVVDRAGLELRSCECYEIVRKEYIRLLPFVERRTPSFCSIAASKLAATRKGDQETSTTANAGAADRYGSAVRLDQFANYREAHAESSAIKTHSTSLLHERLKDVRKSVRCNPDPIV